MTPRLPPTTLVTLVLTCLLAGCKGHLGFDEGGCDDDVECGLATLHCDLVTSTCVACTADAQCTALGLGRDRCDTAAHTCVECGVDSDCGQGRGCHFRHCVTLCDAEGTSSKCPSAAPYCEEYDSGFCIQCGDDLPSACTSATAAGPICGRLGTCVACQGNADCKAPSGRCETFSGRCVECLGTNDCGGATPVCDPTINRCVVPG